MYSTDPGVVDASAYDAGNSLGAVDAAAFRQPGGGQQHDAAGGGKAAGDGHPPSATGGGSGLLPSSARSLTAADAMDTDPFASFHSPSSFDVALQQQGQRGQGPGDGPASSTNSQVPPTPGAGDLLHMSPALRQLLARQTCRQGGQSAAGALRSGGPPAPASRQKRLMQSEDQQRNVRFRRNELIKDLQEQENERLRRRFGSLKSTHQQDGQPPGSSCMGEGSGGGPCSGGGRGPFTASLCSLDGDGLLDALFSENPPPTPSGPAADDLDLLEDCLLPAAGHHYQQQQAGGSQGPTLSGHGLALGSQDNRPSYGLGGEHHSHGTMVQGTSQGVSSTSFSNRGVLEHQQKQQQQRMQQQQQQLRVPQPQGYVTAANARVASLRQQHALATARSMPCLNTLDHPSPSSGQGPPLGAPHCAPLGPRAGSMTALDGGMGVELGLGLAGVHADLLAGGGGFPGLPDDL